jgi:hypothetical protein
MHNVKFRRKFLDTPYFEFGSELLNITKINVDSTVTTIGAMIP